MENSETLAIYESSKAMIDSQIATAKFYPRNVKNIVDNCIATINLSDKEDIEKFVYTVPRGNKKLTGISTSLATMIVQFWGNIRVESRVVEIDHRHVTADSVCFDLEKNYANKKSVKRLILDSNGDRFTEDMITVTGNAASSIAQRNAILSVIPKLITNKIYAAVKRAITGDISSEDKLIARRKIVVDGLMQRYNVTESEVLSSIGKETIEHIREDEIVQLVGIETALKEGGTNVEYVFRGKKRYEPPQNPNEKRKIEMIKNATSEEQLNALKSNLKTNLERAAWEDKLKELKEKK